MTVRKLYIILMSTQNQLQIRIICPPNMHIHARLTNQAAQNAYDFNKRKQTTGLCRAR